MLKVKIFKVNDVFEAQKDKTLTWEVPLKRIKTNGKSRDQQCVW